MQASGGHYWICLSDDAAITFMKTLPVMPRMNEAAIREALRQLNGWEGDESAISKHFVFADFNEAFAFLTRIALLSEKMNHHAAWSGVYNKVSISLSTHDAGGVTGKDIEMALAIEGYAASK
jgi:4a-hydroxytetrahydrobiopterin dehydratase